jgi:hypothetical protein
VKKHMGEIKKKSDFRRVFEAHNLSKQISRVIALVNYSIEPLYTDFENFEPAKIVL